MTSAIRLAGAALLALAIPAVPVALAGSGHTVLLRVPFKLDSHELGPLAIARLEKAVPALQQDYGGLRIEAAGHTDNLESDAYNEQLSLRRAQAVIDYLAAHGVDVKLYFPKGYGRSQPLAGNETRAGRVENRRVELRLLDDARPGDFTNP